MAGRTSFPLDSTQISMFYLIDPANVETVIVDQRLSDKVSFVMFYMLVFQNLLSTQYQDFKNWNRFARLLQNKKGLHIRKVIRRIYQSKCSILLTRRAVW